MRATPDRVDLPAELPPATGAARLVSSLRYRDWRYLWSGLMVSQTGEWMDHIAINWLVLVQTNSPLALGLVNLARGISNLLFSLPAGVIADRFDRRGLMISTQIGGLIPTLLLAVLAQADQLALWHIFVLVGLRSTIIAFNQPARASMIGDLVPRSEIGNAIALHSTTFNGTRMVGPAIAGILIAVVGTAFVLWIHVAAYVIGLWTLLAMRMPRTARPDSTLSSWGTLLEGLDYVRREPDVRMLIFLVVFPFALGQPYQSLLPVFARDILVIGSEGLGLLTSAAATGSLVGSFAVASLGDFRHKGLAMTAALVAFGAFIAIFAFTPWPPVAALVLFLLSVANQVYMTSNTVLLQLMVPSGYRGRVMSVLSMDRGFIPIGSAAAGAVAEVWGAQNTVGVMGGTLAVAGLWVLLFVPRMRRLE